AGFFRVPQADIRRGHLRCRHACAETAAKPAEGRIRNACHRGEEKRAPQLKRSDDHGKMMSCPANTSDGSRHSFAPPRPMPVCLVAAPCQPRKLARALSIIFTRQDTTL